VEIIDFLRAARRRLALVILLPLISMAATVGLLLGQPASYTATAVVDPPALVGSLDSQYTGAQGVNQFVSAFQATASGPVVRRAVADQTKVSTTRLNNGLVVSQRGTSASLSVVYTADEKDSVVPVLNGVTATTLRTLFESQVQSAQARVDSARRAVADATTAIGAFTSKNVMADPQKAYEAQLSRVNSLVQQQATLTAAGNSVGAAAMASPIASAKADLAKFGPILTEYSTLTTARDTAVQGLAAANAKLSAASVQLANADPSKIVYIGGSHAVDRLPQVLTTTASVGAAAFFLALVLVLILEVVARGRRDRDADTTIAESADGQGAHASVDGHLAHPATPSTEAAHVGTNDPAPSPAPAAKTSKSGAENVAPPSLTRPANRG
jgi:hypothetical protein